jgi:hypothetical protein
MVILLVTLVSEKYKTWAGTPIEKELKLDSAMLTPCVYSRPQTLATAYAPAWATLSFLTLLGLVFGSPAKISTSGRLICQQKLVICNFEVSPHKPT